jgi:molecular chaperone HtpG
MIQETGTISINTENIFPIIKKFLYSDHEIFLRELVSNAVDAAQKMKRLSSLGHYNKELGDLRVKIAVDAKAKTITVSDNGIGMTAEEIKKYINQIAFSGATEFMEKFKEAQDANEIIGRFGLGFYSTFMVADKVEIQTLSYQDGAEPPGGSVTEVLPLRSLKAIAQREVPMLFYISTKTQKNFYRNTGSVKY